MIKIIRVLALCFFLAVSGIAGATAQSTEKPSPMEQKAEKIVNDAFLFVKQHQENKASIQKAFETDPRFIDHENGLYIFMHAYNQEKKEAVCFAHGVRLDLIGKNMWSLRTPAGRLLFHEFITIIENEKEGWLEYDWLNPFSNEIQTKKSFLKGIILDDGTRAWIGCGIWEE